MCVLEIDKYDSFVQPCSTYKAWNKSESVTCFFSPNFVTQRNCRMTSIYGHPNLSFYGVATVIIKENVYLSNMEFTNQFLSNEVSFNSLLIHCKHYRCRTNTCSTCTIFSLLLISLRVDDQKWQNADTNTFSVLMIRKRDTAALLG